MKNFIVAGQQRTGTTMLVRTLDQHEDICCRGELFIRKFPNRTRGSYESYFRQSVPSHIRHYLQKKQSTERFLDEVFSAPRRLFVNDDKWRHCKAVGFKLMYGQARKSPQALNYVRERQVPVIHLVRRNALRVLVSREVNRVFDIAHATQKTVTPRVSFDTDDLIPSLKKVEWVNLELEKLLRSNPYLKVYYEDMVDDRPRELMRIADFLGVARNPWLVPPTVKLNSVDLDLAIANFGEVAAVLRGSDFQHCLIH